MIQLSLLFGDDFLLTREEASPFHVGHAGPFRLTRAAMQDPASALIMPTYANDISHLYTYPVSDLDLNVSSSELFSLVLAFLFVSFFSPKITKRNGDQKEKVCVRGERNLEL